jgi:hypothetical protein
LTSVEEDFLVIDTEGAPILREVALVDARGELRLEARTPQSDDSYHSVDLIRPLPDLLRELRALLRGHRLVAHNASHDRAVLQASYQSCGLEPPVLDWLCTKELAQRLHPGLDSHALAALCDQLGVGAEPFHRDGAHQAAYDARFTYLLYRHLRRDQHCRRLAEAPNPFSSSRVDTPFQTFADDRQVHEAAFRRLSAVLHGVAGDANRQSQGAVLIGEPGAGKTHLVMRLAGEVLQSNRLLFVRQPTQAATVLFHIYSRTLESLVEPVGQGPHSQLDLLLIRAIRRIFASEGASTERDRAILAALEAEDLHRLGQEGAMPAASAGSGSRCGCCAGGPITTPPPASAGRFCRGCCASVATANPAAARAAAAGWPPGSTSRWTWNWKGSAPGTRNSCGRSSPCRPCG